MTKLKIDENNWQIWGIPLCSSDYDGVLRIVKKWLDSKEKNKWIATVNPEFVVKATEDTDFMNILKQTDLNVVDGIGLIWAKELNMRKKNNKSKMGILLTVRTGFEVGFEILKGKHRKKLAAGSDLIEGMCDLASKKGYKVFFLGGWKDRAERTAKYFEEKFKLNNLRFEIDFSSGEPDIDNEEVIKKINKFRPDILFVAYGMKRQEEWINNNRGKLDVGVMMGVGRSFDYYSGDLKRAPERWRKMGMEWLYSLIKEPKRFKRQMALPKFVLKVITE